LRPAWSSLAGPVEHDPAEVIAAAGLALGNSGPIRCCQHQAVTTPKNLT